MLAECATAVLVVDILVDDDEIAMVALAHYAHPHGYAVSRFDPCAACWFFADFV